MSYVDLQCTNPLCPGAELDPDAEVVLTSEQWKTLIDGLNSDSSTDPDYTVRQKAWKMAKQVAKEADVVITPVTWSSRYDRGDHIDPPSFETPECPSCDDQGEVL